ncbi:MAG: hypothetical protein Q8P05_03565 [Candidatus Diapherotrites archaeon]|nr:hypothetical protein [Candidatus Diapherotrites archaeon]MDZ4256053.1 hypothetical protein [archaeon]
MEPFLGYLLILGYVLILLSAFLIDYIVYPFFIRRMHLQKIEWGDFNKKGKPIVAGMGGTVVLLGFIFAVMIALFFHSYVGLFAPLELLPLLAAILTIVVVGLIGIVDDVIGWTKGIRQYQHALFPLFAALPLMVLPQVIGDPTMDIPLLGLVNLGLFYSLLVVPIAVTGASNAMNMLAGLNGLEGGMGLINAIVFLIVGLALGEIEVIILMLALIGVILAFLAYNWFPARVFPGDSFTLMMGAAFASVSIIGNLEKLGLMLFLLYFIELILKARMKMQAQSFGIIQEDGTLQSPEKIGSLTHVVMRFGKFSEKQVVLIILGLQVIVALFALFVFWSNFTATGGGTRGML